jgi:hypothetical protein
MAAPRVVDGSRFTVHSHALAGAVTVATWLSLCTGFGLEVAPARDPVDRLYQMEAARDALARQVARPQLEPAFPAAPAVRLAAPAPAPAPVPGT